MNVYGSNDWIRVNILQTRHDEDHFHKDVELFYVLEGTMDLEVAEVASHLEPGDVVVVNAQASYRYDAAEGTLFAKLTIATQLIDNTMQSSDVIFWCDSTRHENDCYDELRQALRRLLRRYLSLRKGVANFGYYAACYDVLDILTSHFLLFNSDREAHDAREPQDDRIAQINRFIHANYDRPISTKDLAKELFLSQGYLSRFFKRTYGMNFTDYLTSIRLYHALDDLLYSDKPISRVAFDSGFTNANAFYKALKDRYGTTPTAMRKKLRSQEQAANRSEDVALAEGRLEEVLVADSEEQPDRSEPLTIVDSCSATASEPMATSWTDTINIGAAADLLRSDIREHVRLLAEEFGFTHVRFWNIFAEELLIDPCRRNIPYNFSRLDEILDFLVDHDLKPHIDLGIKPRRLYSTVQNALIYQTIENPFTTRDEWIVFLEELMEHLRRRYHRSTLNNWRIELWFDENEWGDEDAYSQYCELFTASYRVIKSQAAAMEVGGCGLRNGPIEVDDSGYRFLKRWAEEPCRPDFISCNFYAYETGEVAEDRYSKRSTDNDALRHRIQALRSMVERSGLTATKLYLTEWNLTVSDRNAINDSCFKGAYIVKNSLDGYGLVDAMTYFMGSDRFSEYFDSAGLFYGGSGLVSKDGIIKPAGYALKFLSWLYPYFVNRGANYLVSMDRTGSFGIVCHHQSLLNYNYFLTREDEIQRDALPSYFDEHDPLHLTLTVTDIAPGLYQIKTYVINEAAGNALGVWKEMSYEIELTANDLQSVQCRCRPKLTIDTVEVETDALPLEVVMEPNEIRFIRIRPVRGNRIVSS